MITEQTISGVTKKKVTSKKTGREMVIYEITTEEGTTWTTTQDQLALEAHSRVGHLVAIDGKIEQNGNFKNYYLNGIQDPGELNATITQVGDKTIPDAGIQDTSDERDEKIFRQVATKVAANMSASPRDFWENVDILMNFYRYGDTPDYTTDSIPDSNHFVPEGAIAAGVGVGDTVDDDLPF